MPDRRDARPSRTVRNGGRRLIAAFRVGQEDQIGVRVDDELRRELRVAAAVVGSVGDVAEPHERVQLADEGRRGRREIRRVQLVVVRRRRLEDGKRRGDLLDLESHRLGEAGRLLEVARGLPELVDLPVRVVERHRGGLQQDRDVQRLQRVEDLSVVFRRDHQIRFVGCDGLDVRLEPGEIGGGGLRRVVRLIVDRGDLITGADGEQHLRCGRRDRHDRVGALGDLDRPVGGVDRDRERLL
jgi:hypothetical protein